MDQLPLSTWSYTSGRASRPPGKWHASFHTTLQGPISSLASWCQSLWRDITQRLRSISGQESKFHNRPVPIRVVRAGQPQSMEKPLPMAPASAELGFMPRAPPPLAQRQYHNHPASPKVRSRPLTWSEVQINNLQEENRKLRSQIISQKRVDADKDHIISMLRQHNSRANRELNRQNEALTRLADMAVAIRSCKDLPHTGLPSERSTSLDHGALDEVIRIYSNLQPGDWQSDTIQSLGSTYTQHQESMPDHRAHNPRGNHLTLT